MVFDYFRATKSQTNPDASEQQDQTQAFNLIKTTSQPEFNPSMTTTSVPQDMGGEALDRSVTEGDFNGHGDIDQAHLLPTTTPNQVPNSLLSDETATEVIGDALQKDLNPVESMAASVFAPPVTTSTAALEPLPSFNTAEVNMEDAADTTNLPFLTSSGNELSGETTFSSDAPTAPEQEQMADDTQLPEKGDSALEGAATDPSQAESQTFSFPDTTVPLAPVGATPTSAEIPSMKCDLSRYRPGPLPKSFERASSTPPPCGTHYSFMANWPPRKPPTCDLKNRIDVFPPKDAPLHVWIQAYSLRWAVWCAEIKDEAIRERVLGAVTDKMKMAWETAINLGYYNRPPPADVLTDQQNESDGQKKKNRKRAVSPSRQPAGFACDGPDKTAVTNGELQNLGLTMEAIIDRAQRRDFQEGEAKLDDVMFALDGSRIMIGNWSIAGNKYGIVAGRNLLMYCFYTVQETRTEQERLRRTLQKMKGPQQMRTTQHRIDISEQREHQHMALATELTLIEKTKSMSDSVDKDDDEVEDITPVDLVSEADNTDDGHAISDDSQLSTKSEPEVAKPNPRELIVDLVRDLLGKKLELEIHAVFTSRKLTPMDFSSTGLDVGDDPNLQSAKGMLADVFETVNSVINLRSKMSREQPNEAIRMGHEARLRHEKIENAKQKLFNLLKNDLYPPQTNDQSTTNNQLKAPLSTSYQTGNRIAELGNSPNVASSSKSPIQTQDRTTSLSSTVFAPSPNDVRPAPSQVQSPVQFQATALPVKSTAANSPLQAPARGINVVHSSQDTQSSSSSAKPPTEADIQELRMKQAFVAQYWGPFMNTYITKHNISQPQSPITSWAQMRDIFATAGMTTDERNMMNRKFKAGFEAYKQQHGMPSAMGVNTAPPIPPTPTNPSFATPNTSIQQVNIGQWPSDDEIISAIPPQGIAANELLQRFDARIGGARQKFMERIPHIARYNPHTYMIYPPMQKVYNTAPPQFGLQSQLQSRSTATPAHEMSPSPAQPNRNIVKLKVAPQNQHPSNVSPLAPVNESTFPTEFKSTEVSSSQGFSFRWLPHTTLAQRQRNDDAMGEYISKMSKSRRKKHGLYVNIPDVDDPSDPPVAHGVWQIGKKQLPEDFDWFFKGEGIPVGFSAGQTAGEGIDGDETNHMQSQPRLKLKVNKSAPTADGQDHTFTKYNIYPPAYPGTVNPTQLSYDYTQSYPPQTPGKNAAAKRGTKRAAAGNAGRGAGARSKKRRTNANTIIEDGGYEDAGDSDYDPTQD